MINIIFVLSILFASLLALVIEVLNFRLTAKIMHIPWGKKANKNSKAFTHKNALISILFLIITGIGFLILGNLIIQITETTSFAYLIKKAVNILQIFAPLLLFFREIKYKYSLKSLPALVFFGLFLLFSFVSIFLFFIFVVFVIFSHLPLAEIGGVLALGKTLFPFGGMFLFFLFSSIFSWIFLFQPLLLVFGDKVLRTMHLFDEEHSKKYFVRYAYALSYGFLAFLVFSLFSAFSSILGIFALGITFFVFLFFHYRKHADAYVPAAILAFLSMALFSGIYFGGKEMGNVYIEKNTQELVQIIKNKSEKAQPSDEENNVHISLPKAQGNYSFQQENNNSIVLYRGEKVENADGNTFEILANGYAKDAENVFYETEKIHAATASSFSVIGNSLYAEDGNYIFYKKIPLAGADAKSFMANGVWAKDKNGVFFEGQRETDEEKIKNAAEFLKDDNMISSQYFEKKTQKISENPLQTLNGEDADNDGVWDNVQEWIDEKYGDMPNIQKSLRLVAQEYQFMILNAEKKEALQEYAHNHFGTDCLFRAGIEASMDTHSLLPELEIQILNTKERSLAYQKANQQLSGEFFDTPSDKELKEYCGFEEKKEKSLCEPKEGGTTCNTKTPDTITTPTPSDPYCIGCTNQQLYTMSIEQKNDDIEVNRLDACITPHISKLTNISLTNMVLSLNGEKISPPKDMALIDGEKTCIEMIDNSMLLKSGINYITIHADIPENMPSGAFADISLEGNENATGELGVYSVGVSASHLLPVGISFVAKEKEKESSPLPDAPEGYYEAVPNENEEKIDIENAWIEDKAIQYLRESEDIFWNIRMQELNRIEGISDGFCGKKGCIYILSNGRQRIYENGKENLPVFIDKKISEDTMQTQSVNTNCGDRNARIQNTSSCNNWKQKIGYGYYIEEGKAWYFDMEIHNGDTESFLFSDEENHAYAKDKNTVYCQGKKTDIPVQEFSWDFAKKHAEQCPAHF